MNYDWSLGVAACSGVDPNVFFIDTKDLRLVRQAKAYCDRCPVRRPCLEYAYTTGEQGIWGGTTDAERPFAYMLLQAVVSVPIAAEINVVAKYRVGIYDFGRGKTLDAKLHRLDALERPSVLSDTPSPYTHSQRAYRLAAAIRILRRERERVLEASRYIA